MSIHQISVAYQADEDRLLLRLRTHAGELLELWLTRRMMVRLWAPLQRTADRASIRGASPGSTVLPEAQDMMKRVLREKSREVGDFESPFDESFTRRPLGERPLLVHAVDLQDPGVGRPMSIKFRDAAGREVSLDVGAELLLNLLGLMEQALARSEWGLQPAAAEAPTEPASQEAESKRVLN